jgi:CheY-like chemotaxis protein
MQFPVSTELLKGWNVLVVDDEPDSLLVAERLLKKCGANVLTAPDGKAGLNLARQHRPQFIISDLSMPEMSGWEMLKGIKNTPIISHIPIIALTAHAMTADRVRAMEAGFHNYLSKPLMPETFVNDLLKLLIDVPEIADRLN